jgi:DNA-nicking Smr family endonuclease
MACVRILNIEAGMPTIEQARQILISELKQARHSGLSAVKVIRGHGSTGKGGALRGALRTSLLRRKKEGLVTRSDRDLNRSNEGITIALLV